MHTQMLLKQLSERQDAAKRDDRRFAVVLILWTVVWILAMEAVVLMPWF